MATISKNNFIIIYYLGDSDSYSFASYYADKHSMNKISADISTANGSVGGVDWEVNGQLLGIDFSDNSEILLNESDFNLKVLNPIIDAISNSEDLSSIDIYGIVVGYKVPGGFYDGEDIISTTSRLSRLNYIFDKQEKNPLYNRAIFKRFDQEDSVCALICSRIDAQNLLLAKEYVDNAFKYNADKFINGKFYFDPYSNIQSEGSSEYNTLLEEFEDVVFPKLNLDMWKTSFVSSSVDSVIPFIEDDSFVWSWFTDRASDSFFRYSKNIRAFFYNADYDGGETIRDENGDRWPFLALSNGYSATAGAMSNPTIDGFLNPSSFFNALIKGATIGEAYLFSSPYLNWTISLFGDPLSSYFFPAEEVDDEEDTIDGDYAWSLMAKETAIIAANLYKIENDVNGIQYLIVNAMATDQDPSSINGQYIYDNEIDSNINVPLDLLSLSNNFYIRNNSVVWKSKIKYIVDYLFDFPNKYYINQPQSSLSVDINTYLNANEFKVSRIISEISGGLSISEDNLLDEGWWDFEFLLSNDNPNVYTNYHFKLQVSEDSDFSTILIDKDSSSILSWEYEKEKGVFYPIDYSGVSSSFVGRKIRYISIKDDIMSLDEYLERGKIYYFKITQYNVETTEEYNSRVFNNIIYT